MSTTFARNSRWMAIVAAVVLACAGSRGSSAARGAEFRISDDPAHLDELAGSMQQLANSLCWEMHRFHRQQADFGEAYRPAKELWSRAGELRDALRAGPVDDAAVVEQVTRMNALLATVEATCAKWGNGVRPLNANSPADERQVVVPGTGVDVEIPLLFGGIRVGRSPRAVVTEPAPPTLPRRAFHPNSRGSKRALERELFSVRTVMNYLIEDTGAPPADAPARGTSGPPQPLPPDASAGPQLNPPTKIVPSAEKK